MLGMHGIRYSLKHPEIFKAELNALKRVSEKGKKIGLLFPQVISVEDVKSVKKILSEIKFPEGKIGEMKIEELVSRLTKEIQEKM